MSDIGVIDVTDFLRQKLAWHQAVIRDPQLTQLAKTIASFLLHDFDWRQNGEAYRSQQGLAQAASCSVRAVQKALSQLAHAGFLHVAVARGRTHTNRYRFVPVKTNAGSCKARRNTNKDSPYHPQKANAAAGQTAEKANGRSAKHERGFAQLLLENPSLPLPPQGADLSDGLALQGERTAFAIPSDIRAFVVAERGEGWTRAWFDQCSWVEASRTLTPIRRIAADTLSRELRSLWNGLHIQIQPPARA